MMTPNGTPYWLLRRLAMTGRPPTFQECTQAEVEARRDRLHTRRDARLTLLCARALWSAWRARYAPTN